MKKIFFILLSLAVAQLQAGGLQTLETVVVTAKQEGLIGIAASASEGTVTSTQLENRPLLRPGEVLEVVPGLIVSQHSGDGKANQYYLRGFNLDHGTDFATSLLGMPVNMPTHAHGQGYADMNFLIPELVDRLQYRKGGYGAEQGDFSSAGSASIDYFRSLERSFAQLTLGEYGYRRGLLGGSPAVGNGNLLYGVEWLQNDGPWQMAENLGKFNGLLRYSEGSRDNGWSVAAMVYRARWASTDQVPQRAVDSGLIGRYGNLDGSDGGRSERYSASGEWSRKDSGQWSRANVYAIDYRLDLWSNFTFCLGDMALSGNCDRGDQFQQSDRRQVYGFNTARTWYGDWLGQGTEFTLGLQSRYDRIGKVGLYATTARQVWGTVRQDTVDQASFALYGEGQVQWSEHLRSILGLRGDFYRFDVNSQLAQNSGRVHDHLLSPKLALVFGPWAHSEVYFNAAYGFHSNDARGVTAKVNPDFRDTANYLGPLQSSTPLVRAKSWELGLRSALLPTLQTSLALWHLDLASELVFVGDAGTTEASFPSRRSGIEWANYWTPTPELTLDADLALSRARYREVDASVAGNFIPGAVEKTLSVGVSYDPGSAWSGGLRLRYFGPRPLVEDNSIRSRSSTLVNLRLGYRLDKDTRLFLDVLNLLDRRVSDIDYYYDSQLRGEIASLEDVHTHPAEPRSLRLTLRLGF